MKEIIETYITYKWEERSEMIVSEIETLLNSIPCIRVLRDKTFLSYGESIELFMEKLRHGNIVVMVLSNQYLHSINCMYEMSGLFKDNSYIDRAFPVMVDTSIRDGQYYIDLCNYWKAKLTMQNKLIRDSNNGLDIIKPLLKDVDKIDLIISSLPRLFEYCKEIKAPDAETMQKEGFAELVSRIEDRANKLLKDPQSLHPDLDRLIMEINQLSYEQFAKIVSSYKADYKKIEISGFDGQLQSANPTFVIDDTPMVLYAILHDLEKVVEENQIANIRYTSSKHRREFTPRTLLDTLKIMKYE